MSWKALVIVMLKVRFHVNTLMTIAKKIKWYIYPYSPGHRVCIIMHTRLGL